MPSRCGTRQSRNQTTSTTESRRHGVAEPQPKARSSTQRNRGSRGLPPRQAKTGLVRDPGLVGEKQLQRLVNGACLQGFPSGLFGLKVAGRVELRILGELDQTWQHSFANQ